MKQTYLQNNDRRSIRKKIAIGAGILFVGILVILISPLRNSFTQLLHIAGPQMWETGENVGNAGSSFIGAFASKRTMVEENVLLREENSRLRAEVLDRNLLKEKNVTLEKILGREHREQRIVANVLAGPPRSSYDTLIIDVGDDHLIASGDRVVYAGSGVVGEVSEVYSHSSKVKLLSFPGQKISVLLGTSTMPIIAEGRGMGNFEAHVPRESLVHEGDEVITPDDLIIGIIGAVVRDDTLPYVRVLFLTPFNITEMKTVEVLKGI
ncbi:MAG: hypothetical protein A3B07_01545 [Candidatus Yonathbacteria bacterium RIFCSPLOWO2_01_FULL_43_27]|uniref:Cell shape-determining protein MreC n=1 Tax=Candidatus Yonathbacteria bacterium RIFCSPLOWO2_01_FULL_43_27 TaxID=1802726 RepID=A0A1G2SCS4_9BACT|nr:MAG: hypothetical protein A2658_01340 [Candidatus Yonathbacteria bacterium RIFCSPHIGHO2_01_FULL_44_19]OHA82598.1 MAG: hypothetical protein A3B07_01545 [Candidatus Yonathbacteria bacterium RIFCSPLOWO2_01_FULL_43_27]